MQRAPPCRIEIESHTVRVAQELAHAKRLLLLARMKSWTGSLGALSGVLRLPIISPNRDDCGVLQKTREQAEELSNESRISVLDQQGPSLLRFLTFTRKGSMPVDQSIARKR